MSKLPLNWSHTIFTVYTENPVSKLIHNDEKSYIYNQNYDPNKSTLVKQGPQIYGGCGK